MSKQKENIDDAISCMLKSLTLEQFVLMEMALGSTKKDFDEQIKFLLKINPKLCDKEEYVDLLLDREKRSALFEFWYDVTVASTSKLIMLIEKYKDITKNR